MIKLNMQNRARCRDHHGILLPARLGGGDGKTEVEMGNVDSAHIFKMQEDILFCLSE